ncbi:MAG: hypothetical protein IT577_17795 [Verrucomicrobiae bacterium]|nr:hypothetical protein [Verrucomicrobiae bacterium]
MECFTRLVTVTIGSAGAVVRPAPDPTENPKFGLGPIELSAGTGRARAMVPLQITRAGTLDPDRLALDAAAYFDAGAGHVDFRPLENASMTWQTAPRKGQRDGTCELVIETDLAADATGLCLRVAYDGAEQFRVLRPLPRQP